MIDSKATHDNRQRKVVNDQAYLVAHLSRKYALTIPEVRQIIVRHGLSDRSVFEREASKIAS
jgi:hypothetical protein